MKRCAYCGREQQDDGTNCAECGAELAISPPLSQRPMKASSRALMLAACVAIVLIFAGILTPWPAAKGDWLTLRFIGFTNYSGQRAAAFTVTNRSTRTLSLAAGAYTGSGCTRPIYPDPAPYEPKPPAGAPLALVTYPSAGPYQLKAGQGLTFITAVPGSGGSWHVEVHYAETLTAETLTPWQVRRLKWAQFFWRQGKMPWLGGLIWKGPPKTGQIHGPELRD